MVRIGGCLEVIVAIHHIPPVVACREGQHLQFVKPPVIGEHHVAASHIVVAKRLSHCRGIAVRHIGDIVDGVVIASSADHAESAERNHVFVRRLVIQAATEKTVVTLTETVSRLIEEHSPIHVTVGVASPLTAVVTVACIDVSAPLACREVDVGTCPHTSLYVSLGLCASIISRLSVLLEHDVDDAGSALGAIFCRGVGYDLYPIDAFCRELLKDFRLVVGSKTCVLAVYPDGHAAVAAQGDFALGVHVD